MIKHICYPIAQGAKASVLLLTGIGVIAIIHRNSVNAKERSYICLGTLGMLTKNRIYPIGYISAQGGKASIVLFPCVNIIEMVHQIKELHLPWLLEHVCNKYDLAFPLSHRPRYQGKHTSFCWLWCH